MELSFKDSQFEARRRRSQSGQGTVEYILLLVVIIAVVFGSVYQFNDAFRLWANNYFGDYLSCLLETGELPTVGGSGGTQTQCGALYRDFSLADGKPKRTDGAGGGGGGGGTPPGSGGEDSASSRNRGVGEGGASAGYTRVGRSGGGGGGSFTGSRFAGSGGQDREGGSARRRSVYTGSTESSTPDSVYSRAGTSAGGRRRDLERGFYVAKVDEEKKEKSDRVSIGSSGNASKKRNDRILITRKPAAREQVQADGEMGFGEFFRYLLIAAIVIALVVVLGGQLAQISKEME